MSARVRIVGLVILVLVIAGGSYFFLTRGQESTDDAQVEAHVTPIAAQVGGSVLKIAVIDNQQVEAGAELVVIDPRRLRDRAEARAGVARRRSSRSGGPAGHRPDHRDHRDEQCLDRAGWREPGGVRYFGSRARHRGRARAIVDGASASA
jgi:multidrug efflux pump subunit AcrA (membrane-fusion protein)